MTFLESLFLGALEGMTEFLPISSTGHLILLSSLLGIDQTEAHKSYEIAIQLGSILAVLFYYTKRVFSSKDLWLKIGVAFVPTGLSGLFLYSTIKTLFTPSTVVYMLIIGGVIMIAVELLRKEDKGVHLEEVSYKQAVLIGIAQSFAMVPGTSRSGATIIGGLFAGLNRRAAVEFSFILAVPTMVIATAYDLYKNAEHFVVDDWGLLAVGFVSAFVFALLAIRFFLAFVTKYSFIPFGVYRIFIGSVFLYFIL
jgi:undecaprenyl-diphosphatase